MIETPDLEGVFKIKLSKKIYLPVNCTEWTDRNEGGDKIVIDYEPTSDTLDIIYDTGIDVTLHWKVIECIDFRQVGQQDSETDGSKDSQLRFLQRDEKDNKLIQTDEIQLQFDFS